jgi:molybdopterin-containing oxidoreductase family membrane subunit
MLAVYVLLKAIDTLVWINRTTPATGFHPFDFYSQQPFGSWILFAEIGVCGLLPALILVDKHRQRRIGWLVFAAVLACAGIAVNRFVMTIQTLALPTLPFDQFLSYVPSWQEVATFLGVVAYGVLVYSVSFRYLNLFPQEREFRNL